MSALPKNKSFDFLKQNAIYFVLLILLGIIIAQDPTFLNVRNFSNILTQSSVRLIIALGVAGLLITQGLLVGFVGTLLGAILGVLVTLNLTDIVSAVNPQGVFLPTELSFVQMIFVIGFSLLLSLLSTLYPAYRAAKVEPAAALRYE